MARLPPRWQAWLEIEQLREQHHWLPWRPETEQSDEDCEDPDRMVLFDDISSSLFRINSEELKFELVWTFLEFLGANPLPLYPSCSYQSKRKLQVVPTYPSEIIPDLEIKSSSSEFASLLPSKSDLGTKKQRNCVRNLFEQILPCFTIPQLRTCLTLAVLRFEISHVSRTTMRTRQQKKIKIKEVKKRIKNLLKQEQNRNNMLLYEEYGLFEWSLGNHEEARKVFDAAVVTATSTGTKMSEETKHALCRLYRSYVELEISLKDEDVDEQLKRAEKGNEQKAVELLARFSEGALFNSTKQELSPTRMLKCQKWFDNELEAVEPLLGKATQCRYTSSYAVNLSCCTAYFYYLVHGVSGAAEIFDRAISHLKSLHQSVHPEFDQTVTTVERHLEDVFLSYAKLLLYHMKTNAAPLSRLRHVLQMALAEFPNKTILLQVSVLKSSSKF